MFEQNGTTPNHSPAFTRRAFLRTGMLGGLGLIWPGRYGMAQPPLASGAPAKAVIQIFLSGGLSHIDSFDPKPHAPVEYRGEFDTIASKLDGERLAEPLQRTAKIADRLALIRSFSHAEAAHERGVHNMMTGYRPSPVLTYPSMGSVVAHQLPPRNNLPPYVVVGRTGQFAGTGYLSAAYAPFETGGNPNARDFRVRDMDSPPDVDATRRRRRRRMVEAIDVGFGDRAAGDALDASDAFYRQAYALIESPDACAAFDLAAEPAETRDRYGRSRLGQSLLLARRLVAGGVRYVNVARGGFDNHQRIFPSLRRSLADFDRAFAALIEDLEANGLLDTTLVVVTSEFGRTPRINRDAGRDHWPRVFSIVLAGGGIRRGIVHGSSNSTGGEPARDPVSPADLASTVFRQLGIDPSIKLISPGGRPVSIARDGQPIGPILA